MTIAAEIVDAVFAVIAGVTSLTEADRAAAHAAVAAKLDAIAAADPGPLAPRAAAIRARHLAAIAARHGLDDASMTVLAPPSLPLITPQVVAAADSLRDLGESVILSREHTAAIRVVREHIGNAARLQRSDEPTGRTSTAMPDR